MYIFTEVFIIVRIIACYFKWTFFHVCQCNAPFKKEVGISCWVVRFFFFFFFFLDLSHCHVNNTESLNFTRLLQCKWVIMLSQK